MHKQILIELYKVFPKGLIGSELATQFYKVFYINN
jgi:hypothetical protein